MNILIQQHEESLQLLAGFRMNFFFWVRNFCVFIHYLTHAKRHRRDTYVRMYILTAKNKRHLFRNVRNGR